MYNDNESLMTNIYHLAQERDKKTLQEIVDSGKSISVFEGQYNAIMLLAKEGNDEAVNFLISNFNASPYNALQGYALSGDEKKVNSLLRVLGGKAVCDAVRGYAQGGHVDKANMLLDMYGDCGYDLEGYDLEGYALGGHVNEVDKLIVAGAKRHFAVRGYAKSSRVNEVNKQIEAGAEASHALLGYAEGGYLNEFEKLIMALGLVLSNSDLLVVIEHYLLGGHVDEVEKLITASESTDGDEPIDRNSLVGFFAKSGCISEVNKLIAHGASREEAASGYIEGHYSNTLYNLLYLLTLTHDQELCKLIVTRKEEIFYPMVSTMPVGEDSNSIRCVFKVAGKLKQLMQENKLDYSQAKTYLEAGANNWMIQGLQLTTQRNVHGKLVQNNLPVLPKELYQYITCLVTGMSLEDNDKLIAAVNKRVDRDMASLNASDTSDSEKEAFLTTELSSLLTINSDERSQNLPNLNDKDQNSNKELEAVAQDPSFIATTNIEKNPNTEEKKEEISEIPDINSLSAQDNSIEENRFSFFANTEMSDQQESPAEMRRCDLCVLM